MGFFGNLFKSPGDMMLGIDIGTASIKAVELAREKGGGIKLTNYGTLEKGERNARDSTLQENSLKMFEADIARHLQTLLSSMGTKTRRAVLSIPTSSIFSTILDIPPMPEKEIAQALQFKARQYIPLPISSVSLDFVRVGDRKVLLLAIPKDIIQKYKAVCAACGLELVALEAEGMSAARALTAGDGENGAPALVIDVGGRSTGIFIAERGTLYMQGQTDFAGSALTQGIAVGLGIAKRRAEDFKRERGMMNMGFGAEQELSTLLVPLVDAILNEVKRLRERYSTAYGKEAKRAIFQGGGANMPGFVEYAKRRLACEGEKAFPWKGILHETQAEAVLVPLGPILAVAAGAALRGLGS